VTLEATIEKECCRRAETAGWWHRKVQWVGSRDAPDRVFIRDGQTVWVEFKAPGKVPRPTQAREHKEMREAGATVLVIDDVDDFCEQMGIS